MKFKKTSLLASALLITAFAPSQAWITKNVPIAAIENVQLTPAVLTWVQNHPTYNGPKTAIPLPKIARKKSLVRRLGNIKITEQNKNSSLYVAFIKDYKKAIEEAKKNGSAKLPIFEFINPLSYPRGRIAPRFMINYREANKPIQVIQDTAVYAVLAARRYKVELKRYQHMATIDAKGNITAYGPRLE